MVSLDGEVYGVVFAASVTDAETGYVLTADQVAEAAARGINSEDAGLHGPLRLSPRAAPRDPTGQPEPAG